LINQIFVNYSCRINNVAILKELEELKKIVADTKRELEHKNQELEREKREREREREKRKLEQLRSYLTALAPQQEIDSLPRSLLAQTDD
jgi:molecular chaperone GrpE (heat shock protein)